MDAGESRVRTVARSVTWRVSGTIVAVALGLHFTGNLSTSLQMGVAYNGVQFFLFYAHERAWQRVSWGMGDADQAS